MNADPKACPDCGGALEALGTHKGREHFRCRPCNMRFMYSVKARAMRGESSRSRPPLAREHFRFLDRDRGTNANDQRGKVGAS